MNTHTLHLNTPFTRIPNHIIDQILSLNNKGEIKAILAILRKTIGFNKLSEELSLSQLSQLAGITKKTASAAVKRLADMGLISISDGRHFWSGQKLTINVNATTDCSNQRPPNGVMITTNKKQSLKQKKEKTTLTQNVVVKSESLKEKVEARFSELWQALLNHGVAKPVAQKLINRYDETRIKRQLDCISERSCENKSAFLVSAIKFDYSLPKTAKARAKAEQLIQSHVEEQLRQKEALKAAKNASHIKTPSDKFFEIKTVKGDWVDYYTINEKGEKRLDRRPINVILMNKCEFVSLKL